MNNKRILIFLILISIILVGCSSFEKPDQPNITTFIPLNRGTSIGQTFVSRYAGLNGVVLHLRPGDNNNGTLVLNLRSNSQTEENIATSSISLDEIKSEDLYKLSFPPQSDSNGRYYYLLLKVRGGGDLQAGVSDNPDHYLNGSLYINHTPQSGQLTFHLNHNSRYAFSGLVKEMATWITWLGLSLFLYVIPGWTLLTFLWPKWKDFHWAEKLGLAGGVSLAIYPVIILWTHLIGLNIGQLYAWLPPTIGIGCLLWYYRKDLIHFPRLFLKNLNRVFSSLVALLPEVTLLIVIALIILTRFWAIRDLDAPMWGDSYQHTMIAQLLIDNGGLFDSWQPYAELTTFTYHFGFHSLVAVFHWITRLPLHIATLWVGQIVNIMAVVFLFPLAMRLKRSTWTGTVTLLIAGLLVPMPMFYVNWGRYTQLAGLAILPAMVYLSWEVLESDKRSWPLLLLSWITFAGLALTHYRVLIFAGTFFLAFMLLSIKSHPVIKMILKIFWIGIGAALLAAPWFYHILIGKLPSIIDGLLITSAEKINQNIPISEPIGDPAKFLPIMIWLLLPLAFSWLLWKNHKGSALIGLWWFFVYLVANPHLIKLPGTGIVTTFAVFISFYIPASLIIGAATGLLIENTTASVSQNEETKRRNISFLTSNRIALTALITILVLSILSTRKRLWDVDPFTHALVTRPDLIAQEWIKENMAPNSGFLVNSFFAYRDTLVVGSDAGWWLPLLSNRHTTLPPLNYGSEQDPSPDYISWINEITSSINAKGIDHPDVLSLLNKRKISYVYIGQQQGSVNTTIPMLNLDELISSPNYKAIFNQDRVWIFEISSNK